MAASVMHEGRRDRFALLLLMILAAAAMARVLGNGMVSDDLDQVVRRGLVHSPAGFWRGFVEPYWPLPARDGLYRPLAIAFVTVQWLLGRGSMLVFHLVDLVLYCATVAATWRLLRVWLAPMGAFAAAALFAVHPVHTEVAAQVVNQQESIVALVAIGLTLSLLAAEEGRLSDRGLSWRLLLGQAFALGFKESAVVLPVLLGAVLVLRPGGSWARLRARAAPLGAMMAIVALFWVARTRVLGEVGVGALAVGLPATFGARLPIVLGIVPQWFRLLLWPARLQLDYAPRVLPPWSGDHWAPVLGGVILLLWGATVVLLRRRRPPVALAAAWMGIAMAPVSNLLLPTGTLLAERTLFLASVGFALLIGILIQAAYAAGRPMAMHALVVLLVVAGIQRSARRIPDWHDTGAEVAAYVRDAPTSFRAQLAAGTWAFDSLGDKRSAEGHLREAIRLWPGDPEPYQALADRYRSDGLCAPAIELYRTALARWAGRTDLRASLVACLLHVGDWGAAAEVARGGVGSAQGDWFTLAARVADSAAAARAPAGSVQAPAATNDVARVGH